MSKFDHNFSMTTDDAILYVQEKLPQFFGDQELTCREIGDGNINYIYRVAAADGSKSLIVKHAEDTTRSTGSKASTDRNRIEAEILKIEWDLAPEHVPEIYLYDPVMCCVIMQDIGDHENLRYALLERKTYPTLADDIASFMAQTLVRTSDLILTPEEKKASTGRFLNPAMCNITERLVLSDPFRDPEGSNRLFPGNEDFVQKEIYDDEALCLEGGKLKYIFQTKAQSLIHGDLHSGSIFVKPGSTMVLDPEFAYYGPAGYDVGNVMAHFVFAWANTQITEHDPAVKQSYQAWLEDCLCRTLDGFARRCEEILLADCKDPMFQGPDFIHWFVRDILKDTAGFAGTELLRRVVGCAKFNFIEDIADPEERIRTERLSIRVAKALILGRETGFFRGADYVTALRAAAEEI